MYPKFLDKQHCQFCVNMTGNHKEKNRDLTMANPSEYVRSRLARSCVLFCRNRMPSTPLQVQLHY